MSHPSLVFIVPYRDRALQQNLFRRQMSYVLESHSSYKIFFIHQKDKRSFNRGAMKNIGFLVMKRKYPNDYKQMTFVFNDIDTMPYLQDFFRYETTKGTIKHFYGFRHALGGIVAINGEDFESMNGFPNYWSWGYEDNELQRRADLYKITIDRNQFYPIMDRNIIHLQDGFKRQVNNVEKKRYEMKINPHADGIEDIQELQYNIKEDTVDVTHFITRYHEKIDSNMEYDIRNALVRSHNNKLPLQLSRINNR